MPFWRAIGLGILGDYLNSPAYLAGRKLARADEAAAAGKLLEASRLYGEVAHTRTEYSATARQRCAELVERPEIDSLPLREVTQIFDAALAVATPRRKLAGGAGPRTGDREKPRPGRSRRIDRAS